MRRPEDVWDHIERLGGPDDCWLWTGGKTAAGYGAMKTDLGDGRRQYGAHVLVVYLRDGVVTRRGSGQVVMHSCDNPLCCNPAHLSVGTPKANSQDMARKRRYHRNHARGEALPFSRLTEAQVMEIRALHSREHRSHRSLAREFGVGKTTIEWIVTRRTWRHVDAAS